MSYEEQRTYKCDICSRSVTPVAFARERQMPIGWSWVTVGTRTGPQAKVNRKKLHVCNRCIGMFDQAMKTITQNIQEKQNG